MQMGDSVELCGGTHVDNTSQIGTFIILKESGVSSGVRRVEAICGKSALEYINRVRGELDEVKSSLKSQDPISAIDRLKKQIRELKGEIKSLESSNRERLTSSKIGDIDVIIDE